MRSFDAGKEKALRAHWLDSETFDRARALIPLAAAPRPAYSFAQSIALALLAEGSNRQDADDFWDAYDQEQIDDRNWIAGYVHGLAGRE